MDDDLKNQGGEEGGTSRNPNRLRASELNLLRRLASRFPFTQDDRIKAVGRVNDVLADNEAGPRSWMSAVKAMVSMEKINLTEILALIASQKVEAPATVITATNIVLSGLPPEQLKALYDTRQRLIAGSSSDGTGNG